MQTSRRRRIAVSAGVTIAGVAATLLLAVHPVLAANGIWIN